MVCYTLRVDDKRENSVHEYVTILINHDYY